MSEQHLPDQFSVVIAAVGQCLGQKYLDVVAEETTNAIEGNVNGGEKKTELAELARQGAEAFIDAQRNCWT